MFSSGGRSFPMHNVNRRGRRSSDPVCLSDGKRCRVGVSLEGPPSESECACTRVSAGESVFECAARTCVYRCASVCSKRGRPFLPAKRETFFLLPAWGDRGRGWFSEERWGSRYPGCARRGARAPLPALVPGSYTQGPGGGAAGKQTRGDGRRAF